jgi:pre-rRNA-processing protein TSR2
MLLRNGALSGGSTGQLPAQARPLFEEGATLVFRRWTALSLAVEGQWGGASSVEKADKIWADTMDWFYKNKGAHSHFGKCDSSTTCLTTVYVAIHPMP